jgi:hypothetical protein
MRPGQSKVGQCLHAILFGHFFFRFHIHDDLLFYNQIKPQVRGKLDAFVVDRNRFLTLKPNASKVKLVARGSPVYRLQ